MLDLTPQQQNFLAYYTDPKSETFANAYRSAIKAGYGEHYASDITTKNLKWLEENVAKSKRLLKAEKNLDEVQELQIKDDTGKVDTDILRERNKVDMFFAETIGKNSYSKRNELTGKDGKELPVPIINITREDVPRDNSIKEDTEVKEED